MFYFTESHNIDANANGPPHEQINEIQIKSESKNN